MSIYTPTGKAHEYAELAVNIYKGCTHGCKYCFAAKYPWTPQEVFYSNPDPKADLIKRLTKDCIELTRKPDPPSEILISFVGDPYQPIEMDLHLTRQTIQTLINFDLPFTILTKGGMYAVRDFDLLSTHAKTRFGTTLCFFDQDKATRWEPGAARIQSRVMAMEEAKRRGIPTWVSLEPVIDPAEALLVIKEFHSIVDHWKIGKINHHRGIENSVDWHKFRADAVDLLESIGADYYLKNSLTKL